MQKIKAGDTLGNNIRDLRISKRMTQEQMVAKMQICGVDISRGTYAKMEAGIHHISLSELKAMRQVLCVAWEDMLEGTKNER